MKIKYNIKAFEEIRRLPAVAAEVDSRAARIAAAAGPGYESSPYRGATRHRASVITTTPKAMQHEKSHRGSSRLLRAIDAGR